MNKDTSHILYSKYISSSDNRVKISLISGREIQGKISGVFFKDPDSDPPIISKWNIVSENDTYSLGYDHLGFSTGEIINHKDIAEVEFLYDNSVFIFRRK